MALSLPAMVSDPATQQDFDFLAQTFPIGGELVKNGTLTSEQIAEIEAAKITGQITSTQIADDSISTPKLQAASVISAKIAAGTIVAGNIAAEAITAEQIAAGTITATEIKAKTIEGSNIKAGTITGGLIAAETLTAGLIEAGTITAVQIKAGTITANEIAAHTITAVQIAAGTITATEIKAGTISAGLLEAESVETKHLKAEAVEAGKIKADTITATQIAAEAITTSELAALAVTSAKIAAGTIVSGNIAAGGVTAGNISVSELSALSANLGTITAGTVTGATLRTAAEGNRVVIDSKGLHAYKGVSTGVLDFDIETGNLKLTGTIEEGSTIPAPTITGQLTNAQIKELEAAKISGKLTGAQVNSESIIYSVIAGFPIKGQMTMAKAPAAEYTLVTGEAKYFYVHKKDKQEREFANLLEAMAAAGEPLNARIVLTSAKDSTRYAIFKVKSKTNVITSTYYWWEVEFVKGTAEFESGEELYFSFSAGALVAESLTAGYIAAGAITTGKLAAEAITAEKIAASTITTNQIAANTIEAGDIKAGTITTTEIAANTIVAGDIAASTITATQIAGETITGAKIAAGTITATKLSVEELSAITANLGTITAGTLKAVKIEGGTGDFTGALTAESLTIPRSGTAGGETPSKISWKEGSNLSAEIFAYHSNADALMLRAGKTAGGGGSYENLLRMLSYPALSESYVDVQSGGYTKVLLNQSSGSSFIQYALNYEGSEAKAIKINFGTYSQTFPTSPNATAIEVTHGLGTTPTVVIVSLKESGTGSVIVNAGNYGATTFKGYAHYPPGTNITNTIEVAWIAIG